MTDELEQLRQHDREATNLTIDQQVEIGQLRLALERALHYVHEAERAIQDALNVRQS